MNTATRQYRLESLPFENRFTRELPGDPNSENTRRQVNQACYSRVLPTPVAQPTLVAYSQEVLDLLGLALPQSDHQAFADVFAGNRVLKGMDPFAMCYGGHQFGNWAGQLGDGRAINLGEVVNASGENWTLQLKGAGPTPYSRTADGLAVLRSSVREFLCSEAMYHLGVPTTRALSLVLTGDQVMRDMFYDGHPRGEPGAIVCRVAPSFVRFGSFEIFASRGDVVNLRRLADYTIRHDFPHLECHEDTPTKETYIAWFAEVCQTTAVMIAHWMRVGFVHGVMNTDNMSILGLTIDYGPYGWLEDYDPDWTPNTTDATGKRYRFGQQPQIALWNLLQFANAIYPLIDDAEPLQAALGDYSTLFETSWHEMLAQKLGWSCFLPETDADLTDQLFRILRLAETDMTLFFRKLADVSIDTDRVDTASNDQLLAPLMEVFYREEQLTDDVQGQIADWLRAYAVRSRADRSTADQRRARMLAANPKYVLRNYLAQLAIDKAENGDMALIHELLDVLRNPYDEQPENNRLAAKRPDWARHRPGCSMLSCSS